MHKLGIIIPFRDRWDHLSEFYKHIIPYLDSKNLNFKIILVEQDNASAFNRGMLCNIGFIEAVKQQCDYVVFHDVDLLPEDIDYSYSDHPVHLASDTIPFSTYFGGITLFPSDDFKTINGFSNLYWGWGFEDDDLRYRCDIKNISYGIDKPKTYKYKGKTIFFNGVDAYVEIDNKINYLRDFNISIDIRLGNLNYDITKAADTFPILTIKGYDLTVGFNSFNRFYLQFFDKKDKYYDIISDIVNVRGNTLGIRYNYRNRTVTFTINDKKVKELVLDAPLYDYKNSESIILGTDSDFKTFFNGSIDKFAVESNNKTLIDYESSKLIEYSWENKIDNNISNRFYKVNPTTFTPEEFLGRKVPHRRISKIKKLQHEDSGFVNGRWKHDMTRWNQLRFNNEVVNNKDYRIKEGLSTCQYTLHGKEIKNKVVHLIVGI